MKYGTFILTLLIIFTLLSLLAYSFTSFKIRSLKILKSLNKYNLFHKSVFYSLCVFLLTFLIISLYETTNIMIKKNDLISKDTSVNLSSEIKLDHKMSFKIIDEESKIYRFFVVPYLNGIEFGSESEFIVLWNIKTDLKDYTIEKLISKNNQLGMELTLEKGDNIITSTVLYKDKSSVELSKIRVVL